MAVIVLGRLAVMTGHKNTVIHLHRRDPQEALARLNRITGLQFAHWPESLLAYAEQTQALHPEDTGAHAAEPVDPVVSSG